MKLKQATRYNLTIMWKSVGAFYLAIIAIYIIFGILLTSSHEAGSISLDGSFTAFIFILGVVFFIETLKLFLQNGISRKTMFYSFVFSFTLLSLLMALVDVVIYLLSTNFTIFSSILPMLYGDYLNGFSLPVRLLFVFLSNFSLTLLCGFMGVFGASFFSKLSKLQKVIIPVGFVLLIISLVYLNPIVGGVIGNAMIKFFMFVTGMQAGGNINYLTVSFLVISIILAGLFWLTVRRATIKN